MNHEDFIKFLQEDSLVVRIQKEPAEQQFMRSMLGGFSKVDPKHPVWADVLEIPNITLVKLSAVREKFLPKGMEGIMTEEARNERERKPEDGLEIHEGEGIKAGMVLNIRGKPTSPEFKFTFVTSQPQRMLPIIPRLSVRLWVKSDGINMIPEGEAHWRLVPLETRVFMELTTDIMGPWCWREDKLPPAGVIIDWPKLNPHSQLIMDRFRDKGLVNLITTMPEEVRFGDKQPN